MSRGRLATWVGWTVLANSVSVMPAHAGADLVTPASRDAIVLRLDPRSPASYDRSESDRLALADRLQYQHRFGEAEAVLAAHLANNPDDANALLRRAQVRLEGGRPREALADCLRASQRLSALAASACQAQAMAQLGHGQRARQQIEAALARPSIPAEDSPAIRSWAAGVAAELAVGAGDVVVAEKWFRDSLATAGDVHFPRIAYAQFLLARQRPREALALLAAAPDDSSVMRLRRLALEMMQ